MGKQNFDLVLSYDYNDAKRYDILYYPTPYSAIPVESVTNPDNDVYFLGKGKNRLTEIIDAYERFIAKRIEMRSTWWEFPINNKYIKTIFITSNPCPIRRIFSGLLNQSVC